jgi:hypothetical protein
MITRIFSRSGLHEHTDPAQRVQGVAALPADSGEIAQLLASDPAPEVRLAAAQRCSAYEPLAGALASETDVAVRTALNASLGAALAATPDDAGAAACLAAETCPDAVRIDVARKAESVERRRAALAHVRDEGLLVDLALTAEIAETRAEAAERVQSPEGLRKLAHVAKNKDRGVARHARQRIEAMTELAGQAESADAMLAELEALVGKPGPIVSAMVDLDRRWQALAVAGDDARIARWASARAAVQARFDREQDEQRGRAQFERRLREWLDALPSRRDDAIDALRAEEAALRQTAQGFHHTAGVSMLEDAELRIGTWERERAAQAGAEALVVEAEQLAAGTSIDHADLPTRWAALDRGMRGPALTQRFEAAIIVIEQRRLAQIRATEQQASAARQHVHGLLHTAEQALAAGQLQAARAAADEIRVAKAAAGQLPKPTVQRLSRLVQQLTELERWESFGQRQARLQLCERAEALAAPGMEMARLAVDVQKLRAEWKALDAQHAGVPKAVWERFDGACERAYAPAARHFAEMAAQRKEARRKREEFIAAATAHVPTLLVEPHDLRAIERWLRETDKTWREGDLGSVEPGAWKKFDARMKAALLPLRDAVSAGRDRAKAGREALIAEAVALAARATERDSLNQVKALQAKWQVEAKAVPLAHRDERALWEAFRAACDAVFNARHAKRKEEDERKHGNRRALEEICVQLEALAHATDKDDAEVRRALREAQDQWRQQAGRPDPSMSAVETRFRNAKSAVEAMLSAHVRSRESAVWQTFAAKERLCEDLDRAVLGGAGAGDAPSETDIVARWSALPSLPAASEAKLIARRDAALRALADAGAAADYTAKIEKGKGSRHEWLLELEMALKLDTPADLQAYRLALQVKQLKERFSSASSGGARTPADLLASWCAQPGVADERDRQRCERIVAAMAKGG